MERASVFDKASPGDFDLAIDDVMTRLETGVVCFQEKGQEPAMERIVYKDCEVCDGKGWYYTTGDCVDRVECPDCMFKNGAAVMKTAIILLQASGIPIQDIQPSDLKQPPICMCEDRFGGEHDDDCHLHAEAVAT